MFISPRQTGCFCLKCTYSTCPVHGDVRLHVGTFNSLLAHPKNHAEKDGKEQDQNGKMNMKKQMQHHCCVLFARSCDLDY